MGIQQTDQFVNGVQTPKENQENRTEAVSVRNTPEGQVLDGCLRYLEARGIYHWRNNTGAVQIAPGRFMRFGKVGSSDILGVLPGGRLLCVECKAKGGRLSPEQKQFLADVQKLGVLALVVRGWWELDEALREAGYAMKDMPLFENTVMHSGNNRKGEEYGKTI